MIKAPHLDLTLQTSDTTLALADEGQFNLWCLETLRYTMAHGEALQQHPAWEITVRIVDAEEGKSLNASYRHKDSATNVLSFYYDDPFADLNFLDGDDDEFVNEEQVGLGDIILCAPVILKEAEEQKKSILEHTAHLTVHATLHLLGYDHETEKDAAIMENFEILILQQLGFNNPYEEIVTL